MFLVFGRHAIRIATINHIATEEVPTSGATAATELRLCITSEGDKFILAQETTDAGKSIMQGLWQQLIALCGNADTGDGVAVFERDTLTLRNMTGSAFQETTLDDDPA